MSLKGGNERLEKKRKEVNFCSPTFWKLLFYSSSVHLRIYWNFSTSQLSTNVWATQDYSRLRANYFCGVNSIRNKSLTFTTLLWQLNHYILKIDYSKVFSFRTGTQFFGNVQNFLYFFLLFTFLLFSVLGPMGHFLSKDFPLFVSPCYVSTTFCLLANSKQKHVNKR